MKSSFTLAIQVLILSTAVFASPRADLQGVRKEIQKKQILIKKATKLENKVSGELQQMERSLHEKEGRLLALDAELKNAEEELRRTEAAVERVKLDVERKKREIDRRLVALYKSGETGTLRVLFSSGSLPQMVESTRYMNSVLSHDRKLVEEYGTRLADLRELRGKLEKDSARKENAREAINRQKREIEEEKGKKSTYLSQVRQDKKSYQQSLHQLEENAKRLQSMVERLEAASRKGYSGKSEKTPGGKKLEEKPLLTYSGKGLGGRRGGLALPVRGEIIGSFGRHKHPEFNSYTVSNGISIAAPQGAEIHSIADGRVIFSDYFKGYGNMVIIDHGDGYFSLYAHASRLMKKEGAVVSRGETIASVGDIDSSKGSMLYFEMRHQGKPVDPAPWFK